MAATTFDEWKALSKKEQFEAWKQWDPYSDEDLGELLSAILTAFRTEYPDIASANWGNVHGELQIVVDPGLHACPGSFMGVPVRRAPGR